MKLSINQSIVDGVPRNDQRSFSEGFEPVDISIKELEKHIKNGRTFSYQFKKGIRKSANFIATDFLAVDIDDGLTLDQAINNEFVKSYCSLIYTTKSHTKEGNRFRLIFELESSISNVEDVKNANLGLAKKLSGDKSATDGARIYFGYTKSKSKFLGNKKIPEQVVRQLIQDGSEKTYSDNLSNGALSTATRSKYLLDKRELIKLETGQSISLNKIKRKLPVFCPAHSNKLTGAFVARNKDGIAYLYCPECQISRWEKGVEDHQLSSEHFEKELIRLKESGIGVKEKKHELIGLEPFMFDSKRTSIQGINTQNSKFLKYQQIENGLTFIKSPKGTGKTTSIGNALAKEYKNLNKKTAPKTLLIGHRRSLIRNLCADMGLNSYLTDEGNKPSYRNKYGICLDSLLNIEGQNYDIIIIDEIEQVLAHFLSETIGPKGISIYREFARLLSVAKKIVVMDADLSWVSVFVLTKLLATNSWVASNTTKKIPLNFVVNTWKDVGKVINLYENKDHLIATMKEKLVAGNRVFFTSNSKGAVLDISNGLKKLKINRKPIRLITITADNSSTAEAQDFINNIKSEIKKYDIVLVSPSLSTGVDISFDEDFQIDTVFGLFENRINSHPEIDQQLSRVRNPKSTHVWISGSRYNFETEFDVVELDYLRNRLKEIVLRVDDILNGVQYKETTADFIYMATWLTVLRRSSINNLRFNFIDYKKKQGFDFLEVHDVQQKSKQGKLLKLSGRKIVESEYQSNLLQAKKITKSTYDKLKKSSERYEISLTDDELYSMRRYEIEEFYREDISAELIKLNDKGRYREKARLYADMVDPNFFKIHKNNKDIVINPNYKLKHSVIKSQIPSRFLMREILNACPFYENYKFDSNIVFTSYDLQEVIPKLKKLKRFIEGQFDILIRNDINYKPISQIKQILKLVGLDLILHRKNTISGKRIYYYSLNNDLVLLQEKLRIARLSNKDIEI